MRTEKANSIHRIEGHRISRPAVSVKVARCFAPCALLAALTSIVAAADTGKLEVRNANGKIELSAEDLRSVKFDKFAPTVTNLAVFSDGKQVTIKATLKEVPKSEGSNVINIYLDTDNNSATGMQIGGDMPGGFEYMARLETCIDYGSNAYVCGNGNINGEPTRQWAGITLDRFEGNSEHKQSIIQIAGMGDDKVSARVPIAGNIAQGSISYGDLKVKHGQMLRIVMTTYHGWDPKPEDFFPEIHLKLQ